MKRILTIILFTLMINIQGYSQIVLGIANRRYENLNYTGAIPFYKSLLSNSKNENNTDLIKKLAISYKLTNQNDLAEPLFARLAKLDTAFDNKLMYVESMVQSKKYDQAIAYINQAQLNAINDVRIIELKESLNKYKELSNYNDECFLVSKLPLNTVNESDFAPAFYANGIVFASTRSRSDIVSRNHLWTNRNYTSLYFASETDGYKNSEKFANNLSGKYNFGPATFFAPTRTMYYSVNNQKKKAINGYKNLNIYSAKYDLNKEEWQKNNLFQYNSTEYASTHPCLSKDGKYLYFSSDMPGGLGGMDIYVCQWVDSMWSTPTNLGAYVNTPSDEVFPFIWNDSILYFASNGRGGLGGLDLFSYDLKLKSQKAENMGSPFNSFADDFAYIREAKLDKGYFSSSRGNNGINDDIYSFKRIKNKSVKAKLLVVDNSTDSIISQASIKYNLEPASNNQSITVKNLSIVELDLNGNYTFAASAENYTSASISKKIAKSDTIIVIRLTKIFRGCIVKGNVSNKYTHENIDSALVTIMNTKSNQVEFKTYSDVNGNYKYAGLKPNTTYTISAEKDGFVLQKNNLSTIGNPCTFANGRDADYVSDFKMVKNLLGKKIVIDNIYFDVNKHDIRPDAAIELDKIVKVMNENPEIIIELSSHTDSRGSDKYNLALSDRRAKASASYIVSRGIPKSRIYGVGKGEKELMNQCKNGVVCTEELHQKNRRTEFKIVGFQMQK